MQSRVDAFTLDWGCNQGSCTIDISWLQHSFVSLSLYACYCKHSSNCLMGWCVDDTPENGHTTVVHVQGPEGGRGQGQSCAQERPSHGLVGDDQVTATWSL